MCNTVTNALNIGGFFRIADAFGIKKLILCGKDIELSKRVKRTSRSTEHHVDYSIETDIISVLEDLKKSNHQIIALEITTNSTKLNTLNIATNQPIALIVGNENYGVSDTVLKQANKIVHISMYGHNSSMNVVHAASIALYEFTNQLQNL